MTVSKLIQCCQRYGVVCPKACLSYETARLSLRRIQVSCRILCCAFWAGYTTTANMATPLQCVPHKLDLPVLHYVAALGAFEFHFVHGCVLRFSRHFASLTNQAQPQPRRTRLRLGKTKRMKMQNNHTQNCQGSGCWLQRFVRPHHMNLRRLNAFTSEALRSNHSPFFRNASNRRCQ
jgi:hypothetical protein